MSESQRALNRLAKAFAKIGAERVKVVWKFALGMGLNVITVPVGAKIVHIEMQDGFPQLWAEISDPSSSHVEVRQFEIFGTGHPIPDKAQHVGTFLDPPYVWHVYELVNP